jgi:hypothetical protein
MATPATPIVDERNAKLSSGLRGVQFATQNVQPPSPLLLQLEDQLLVRITSPTIGLGFALFIEMRILRPDGTIVPMRIPIKTTATSNTFTFALTEGFLLSLTASVAYSGTVARGQMYIQAFIARNTQADPEIGWVLLSDYVTSNFHPSWPGTPLKSPLEGPGFLYAFSVGLPAAGADWSQAVPALTRWQLKSIFARFSASVAVANRAPAFSLAYLAGVLCQVPVAAAITASQVVFVEGQPFATYNPSVSGAFDMFVPIPPGITFPAGSFISSITTAIQAADQWAQITLNVEEWVDI